MDSAEISVVVQGPVIAREAAGHFTTAATMQSVRRHLPQAELILSTWRGSPVAGLDFDRLVESDDPGAHANPVCADRPWNTNRQIVSTRAGLERASRAYAIKLRTDCVLESAAVLEWAGQYPDRASRHRFFSERLVGCERFFCNPAKAKAVALFHPTDIFYLGARRICATFGPFR